MAPATADFPPKHAIILGTPIELVYSNPDYTILKKLGLQGVSDENKQKIMKAFYVTPPDSTHTLSLQGYPEIQQIIKPLLIDLIHKQQPTIKIKKQIAVKDSSIPINYSKKRNHGISLSIQLPSYLVNNTSTVSIEAKKITNGVENATTKINDSIPLSNTKENKKPIENPTKESITEVAKEPEEPAESEESEEPEEPAESEEPEEPEEPEEVSEEPEEVAEESIEKQEEPIKIPEVEDIFTRLIDAFERKNNTRTKLNQLNLLHDEIINEFENINKILESHSDVTKTYYKKQMQELLRIFITNYRNAGHMIPKNDPMYELSKSINTSAAKLNNTAHDIKYMINKLERRKKDIEDLVYFYLINKPNKSQKNEENRKKLVAIINVLNRKKYINAIPINKKERQIEYNKYAQKLQELYGDGEIIKIIDNYLRNIKSPSPPSKNKKNNNAPPPQEEEENNNAPPPPPQEEEENNNAPPPPLPQEEEENNNAPPPPLPQEEEENNNAPLPPLPQEEEENNNAPLPPPEEEEEEENNNVSSPPEMKKQEQLTEDAHLLESVEKAKRNAQAQQAAKTAIRQELEKTLQARRNAKEKKERSEEENTMSAIAATFNKANQNIAEATLKQQKQNVHVNMNKLPGKISSTRKNVTRKSNQNKELQRAAEAKRQQNEMNRLVALRNRRRLIAQKNIQNKRATIKTKRIMNATNKKRRLNEEQREEQARRNANAKKAANQEREEQARRNANAKKAANQERDEQARRNAIAKKAANQEQRNRQRFLNLEEARRVEAERLAAEKKRKWNERKEEETRQKIKSIGKNVFTNAAMEADLRATRKARNEEEQKRKQELRNKINEMRTDLKNSEKNVESRKIIENELAAAEEEYQKFYANSEIKIPNPLNQKRKQELFNTIRNLENELSFPMKNSPQWKQIRAELSEKKKEYRNLYKVKGGNQTRRHHRNKKRT